MNSFQKSLDRYLTSESEDNFTPYVDELFANMDDETFYQYESWLNESSGVCNKLLNKLFDKGYSPLEASKIIARYCKMYVVIL